MLFLARSLGRAVAPDEYEEAELDALEDLLRQAHETGRAAWPQVALSEEGFVHHLARVVPGFSGEAPPARELARLLEGLNLAGLYLAGACMDGVPAASEALERDVLARLPGLLVPRLPPSAVDEVCQQVRIHLLVGTEAGPQLALYKAQSSLLSWIRVIAARLSLRQVAPAREQVEEGILAAIEATPDPGNDAELEFLKRRCFHEFRAAARDAFSALQDKPRYLLRLHFIDRLSTIELGRLYGVDQSTASRWLKNARQAVFDETKRLLKERLRLSSREFESLLSDINSRLDMSFSELLQEDEDEKLGQLVREVLSELTDEQRHLLRRHFVAGQPYPGPEGGVQAVRLEMKRRFLEGAGSSSQEISRLQGDLDSRLDQLIRKALSGGL